MNTPIQVLVCWYDEYEPLTIEVHNRIMEELGYVWWAKLASDLDGPHETSEGPPMWPIDMKKALFSDDSNPQPYFLICNPDDEPVSFHIGTLLDMHYEAESVWPKRVPQSSAPNYYQNHSARFWFKIGPFEGSPGLMQLPSEKSKDLRASLLDVSDANKPRRLTFSKNNTYPMLVTQGRNEPENDLQAGRYVPLGLSFDCIQNRNLRREATHKWGQLPRLWHDRYYDNVVYEGFGVIEAVLKDVLYSREARAKDAYVIQVKDDAKWAPSANSDIEVRPIEQWNAYSLTAVARRLNLISRESKDLIDSLRKTRKKIHPKAKGSADVVTNGGAYQAAQDIAIIVRDVVEKGFA